ncbi:MAG: GNAT family N-acetyltransferase [Deltaproteobacteria bacterium]|nr:GNAT family N-acetyltransferase [Deltaproteobacteria bacterium]
MRINSAPYESALNRVLFTPRLVLRPLDPEDAHLLHLYVMENRLWLQPWEPARDPSYYTQDIQRQILYQCLEERRNETGGVYGVFRREDEQQLIGRISLFGISRGIWQNCHLGYSLAYDHTSQGYMTEALRRIAHFCFADLDLHRIQAAVLPRNENSLRLADRCQFRREGVALRYMEVNDLWEDHVILALTIEEVDEVYFKGCLARR